MTALRFLFAPCSGLITVLGILLSVVALAESSTGKVSVLRKQVDDAEAAYRSTNGSEQHPEARETFLQTLDRNIPQILHLLRHEPTADTTVETLVWILSNPINGSRAHGAAAVRSLRDHHWMSPQIGRVCRAVGETWTWEILRPTAEFLRTVAERNPDRIARAQATFALARLMKDKAGYIECWNNAPPSVVAELARYISGDLAAWKKEDLSAVCREAETLFETVLEKYSDCPDLAQGAEGEPSERLASQAKADLYELRQLRVGSVAPDLEGEDLDGHQLKLRGFRGKVVVLSFWASWCAPCMRLLSQERALVEQMKGKPFAMIGVNGDSDRAAIRSVVKQERITWPSFWTGGPRGAIPTAWNVRYWPTVYVLDPAGTIRFKATAGIGLEEVVDKLLIEFSQSPVRQD